jgi:hypothetical protein
LFIDIETSRDGKKGNCPFSLISDLDILTAGDSVADKRLIVENDETILSVKR